MTANSKLGMVAAACSVREVKPISSRTKERYNSAMHAKAQNSVAAFDYCRAGQSAEVLQWVESDV